MRRFLLVLAIGLVLAAPARAWTWPSSGPVLVPFSFDPSTPYAAGQHRGIDVGGNAGESVVAPAAGTITFAGTVPGSGKAVTILTSDGWSVTLTQLGSIAVAKGASVAEGDGIGTIGPSGDPEAAGQYVQLGIRYAGEDQGYVDPLTLLPARTAEPVSDTVAGGEEATGSVPSSEPDSATSGGSAASPAAIAPAVVAPASATPAQPSTLVPSATPPPPEVPDQGIPATAGSDSAVTGQAQMPAASLSATGARAAAATAPAARVENLTARAKPTPASDDLPVAPSPPSVSKVDAGAPSAQVRPDAKATEPGAATDRRGQTASAPRPVEVTASRPASQPVPTTTTGAVQSGPPASAPPPVSPAPQPVAAVRTNQPSDAPKQPANVPAASHRSPPRDGGMIGHALRSGRRAEAAVVAIATAAIAATELPRAVPNPPTHPLVARRSGPRTSIRQPRHEQGMLRWLVAILSAAALALLGVGYRIAGAAKAAPIMENDDVEGRRPQTSVLEPRVLEPRVLEPCDLEPCDLEPCVSEPEEDSGRAGVAICGRAPAPWPRGGVRSSVRRIRPLPPSEGKRRSDGERDGRARHAGDGGRRPGREVLR